MSDDRHFVFRASRRRLADLKPITFELAGDAYDGTEWTESFTCLPMAPAAVLDDLLSSIRVTPQGQQVFHRVSLMAFMRGVLVPESAERFERLASDKNRILEIEALGPMVVQLGNELLDFPSKPSLVSSPSPNGAGPGSTASSPSPVSTPEPSTLTGS